MNTTSVASRVCKFAFLLLLAGPLTAWSQATTPPPTVPPPTVPPAPAAPAPCGNPGDFVVGLAEEFNAPLDPNIWLDRFAFIPPIPVGGYEVSNGSLKLWLQRDETDPMRNFAPRAIFSDPTTPLGGNPQRTGYVQRYGCFEIEAKLPFGKGLFPAFWLAAPARLPEIDIMETYTRDDYADAQLHPIAYEVVAHVACAPQPQDPGCSPTAGARPVSPRITYPNMDLSADFHRYAARWEPNQVTFYLDGNVVHTIPISLADPMYIGLAMIPDPRSLPDDTTPTMRGGVLDPGAAYEVNYVRAWCFRNLGCR